MKENSPVNNNVFNMKDENGNVIECEVLFTFDSPETNKSYLVYTDNKKTEEGALQIYANIYDKTGQNKNLMPIETEEEWNTVEAILAKLEQKDKEENK